MGMKTGILVTVVALGAAGLFIARSDSGDATLRAIAAMHASETAEAPDDDPVTAARGTHAAGADVIVPLEVDGSGRLVVPVIADDGRAFTFAVSTAVPTSMVARSIGGDEPGNLGLRLEGSDQPLPNVQTASDDAFAVDGRAVDGFVGLSTLGDVDVLLDAPGARMVLRPIARDIEWSGVDLGPPNRLQVFHGVAVRLEVEVEGRAYGATLDLGHPRNVMNPPAAHTTGVAPDGLGTVDFAGTTRSLVFEVADTPILSRWDPDGVGFVAFGAAIAADCALALSWFHQEMRMCAR